MAKGDILIRSRRAGGAGATAAAFVRCLILLMLLALGAASPAAAQDAAAPPPPGSEADVDRLLAALDDHEARELLRALLMGEVAAAADADEPGTILAVRERLGGFFAAWGRMPEALAGIGAALTEGGLAGFLAYALGLLACGLLAAWPMARAIARTRRGGTAPAATTLTMRALAALGQLIVRLTVLLAFLAGVSLGSLLLGDRQGSGGAVASIVSNAGAFVILVLIGLQVLLAPRQPQAALLQLEPIDHRVALRQAMALTVAMAAIAAFGQLLSVFGLPREDVFLVALLLSSLVFAWLIVLPWRWRGSLRSAVARVLPAGSPATTMLAMLPLLANVYVLVVWLSALDALLAGGRSESPRIVLAILLPLAIFALARSIARNVLERLSFAPAAPRAAGAATSHPTPPSPTPPSPAAPAPTAIAPAAVASLLASAGSVVQTIWVIAGIAVLILYLWLFDVSPAGLLGMSPDGFTAMVQVLAIVLVAHVAYVLANATIDRRIALLDREEQPTRAKRLRTLLPLLRWLAIAVIVVMAVLISLSELGVDIAPLIAGAGVFGLALGLGTQKLVTDIVSGVFFLIDDAFSIGDYIEVDGKKGTIEALSVRSMKLRHHLGALHNIPFGEVKSVTNYTRDWTIVRLEFRLPSDTDLDKVKKIIKQIGKEIAADPELSHNLMEPLKSQGVRRFEDNAMIVGVKFMAIPGTQFAIRKVVFQRIRDAFLEAGIAFADRGVVVRVDSDHADPQALGAAAQAAIGNAAATAPAAADDR